MSSLCDVRLFYIAASCALLQPLAAQNKREKFIYRFPRHSIMSTIAVIVQSPETMDCGDSSGCTKHALQIPIIKCLLLPVVYQNIYIWHVRQ